MKILALVSLLLFGAVAPAEAGALFTTETSAPLSGSAALTGVMGASFTATSSAPLSLTATVVTGTIGIGDIVMGTGISPGTVISSQLSGTTGGAGTYLTNQTTTAVAASVTDTSTSLHASSVTGPLFPGQVIAGAGITGSPTIVSQTSGTFGGAGVYVLSQGFHIASEAMTGGAQIFTGPSHDFGPSPSAPYSYVGCTAVADQLGTLNLDLSIDGITWSHDLSGALAVGLATSLTDRIRAEYYRCLETGGATTQGKNLVQFGATSN